MRKQILETKGIKINAFVNQVGTIKLQKHYSNLDFNLIESNIVRCPDENIAKQIPKKLVSYDPENELFARVKPDQLVNFWGSENPSEESEDEEISR